jgi:transcriptional regulator with XRE-family HTH domain
MHPILQRTKVATRHKRYGEQLRQIRVQLDLTTRAVAVRTQQLAGEMGVKDYAISHPRLVQIETEDSVPSVHKLFALSVVYGVSLDELLRIYVDLGSAARLHQTMQLPATHQFTIEHSAGWDRRAVSQPHAGAADTRPVSDAVRGDQVPPLLDHPSGDHVRFVVIGASDYTMHPLIQPGSVVQVEECSRTTKVARYQNEYERPIYLIELRTGYICSWCEMEGDKLVSIPHSLSPCKVRVFAYPTQAEIIGRVTGLSMRLGAAQSRTPARMPTHAMGEVSSIASAL